jgi:hypothetical protein
MKRKATGWRLRRRLPITYAKGIGYNYLDCAGKPCSDCVVTEEMGDVLSSHMYLAIRSGHERDEDCVSLRTCNRLKGQWDRHWLRTCRHRKYTTTTRIVTNTNSAGTSSCSRRWADTSIDPIPRRKGRAATEVHICRRQKKRQRCRSPYVSNLLCSHTRSNGRVLQPVGYYLAKTA